jgi:hypothetical protein
MGENAVLTDQRNQQVEVQCQRVSQRTPPSNFFSVPLRCPATCDESVTRELQSPDNVLRDKPQNCPECSLKVIDAAS